MNYQCTKCKKVNHLSDAQNSADYLCSHCETQLPAEPIDASGDTSAVVGMIGGAALGASVGGPVGAIMGALLGNLIGKNAQGLG